MSTGAKPIRIAGFLSGNGSGLRAIQAAIRSGEIPGAEIALVIANRASAHGLDWARSEGIPAHALTKADYPTPEAADQAALRLLQDAQVDLVVLSGYLKILGPDLINAYPNRILNIHPSLLPAHGGPGMYGHHVHKAVLAAGDPVSGCTLHWVTATVDGGPIVGQVQVVVQPEDTPETLAARVLTQEVRLYPLVVARVVSALQNGQDPATLLPLVWSVAPTSPDCEPEA